MLRTELYLTEDQLIQLYRQSNEQSVKMSALIREAIDRFLLRRAVKQFLGDVVPADPLDQLNESILHAFELNKGETDGRL